MVRLYGLLFLVNLALLVIALIDCLSTDEDEIRNLPKIAWVFIILLFSPVGAIVWFVAGRPQRAVARAGGEWRAGGGFPEATRPSTRSMAPDDDPEFLRGLAKGRREDEEMFSKWEADLRRREEELRRREEEEGQDGEGRPPRG
ncbi:PLD nuclease N-terminal domain-containing protein [Dactylosporangium sp. NPDC005572]|uniref:PLD nuclease N-terminal domain-containing protein n=1 Tax=Dactylosporangium sp. NPDC005572 TaxID=3156889 RepID=UPI0033A53426